MIEKALKKISRLREIFSFTKEGFLLNVIKYGVFLSLLTPIIFSDSFFPPPVPATVFFRTVVDIILIAYIFLFLLNRDYRPRFSILTILVSLFFGILILTSFTGVNFEKSFWGNFERMGGLMTFFHLFGFFIVLSSVFKERKDWEMFFSFSVLVGVLTVCFIAFSDRFSIEKGGTLWNSSLFVSYILFNIYLALVLFLTKGWAWRIFYGGSMAILLSALFLSDCRGGKASFFIGLLLLIFGYLVFFKRKTLKRFVFGILFVSAAIVILFLANPDFFKNELTAVWESPTLQARFVVWQISWDGWKEKFLLGWGPENFDVAFFKHFDPRLAMGKYGGEIYFDRAHNIVFDTGTTSGLFGVLSYLAIFAAAIFILLKACKKLSNKKESIFFLGIAVLLAVYFIQNLLVLDTINSYMMFFLILAFVDYVLKEREMKKANRKKVFKKPISVLLGTVLTTMVILICYFGNIQPAKASFYISQAMNSTPKQSILLFQKSFKTHSMSRLEGSKYFYAKAVQSFLSDPRASKKSAADNFQTAEKELEENIKKNSSDFYLNLYLAHIYINSFQLTGNNEKIILAESFIRKAIALSPNNQEGYWKLSEVMSVQGKNKEKFESLQKAIDLEPRLEDFHWYLAMAYTAAGEKESAQKKIGDMKRREPELLEGNINMKMTLDFYKKWEDHYGMGYTYEKIVRRDPVEALSAVQKILKNNPDDLSALSGLFIIYIQAGEIEKAEVLRNKYSDILSESVKNASEMILQDAKNQHNKLY